MVINVTSNFKELAKDFDPVIVDKASIATLNALATKARTVVKKKIRTKYAIKDKELDIVVGRAKPGIIRSDLSSSIFASAKLIPVAKFKIGNQNRKGTPVTVFKGKRKVLTHAFVATMRSSHRGVFWRKREGEKRVPRLPIQEIKGPSVSQMMQSASVINEVNLMVEQDVQRVFNNKIDFYYNKIGGPQ